MNFELREEPDAALVPEAVRRGIREADPADVGPRDFEPLILSLRNPDDRIIGGLYGATMWSWLMIDGLWIDATLRSRGLGRRLLLRGEAIAVARGCRGAWLATFDFQAREFYERLGYSVFAKLPGFPAGHTHFHLRKDLAETEAP
jgi:GNAT superfamily N-acetyltransferase